MGGNFNIDHDRFVAKNRATATAELTSRKDRSMEKKGFNFIERQQEASCKNCKLAGKCVEFRNWRTGGSVGSGAVSFGGNELHVCSKYVPQPVEKKGMSDKQVKSLMKSFKKQF